MRPLEDVVALVVSRPLGPVNTKQAISSKLESLGARVAARLGKEVTHVVFQRQRHADAQEQLAEDSELRGLYDRTAKMGLRVDFISPLWVDSCASADRRVLERNFAVAQPAPSLFTYTTHTPGSGSGPRKPARRRSVLPKPADDYAVDVTDALFSSSQQIRGGITAGREAEEVASPALGAPRAPSRGKKRPAPAAKQRRQAAAPPPEEECCAGSGTQLAAEMLAGMGDALAEAAPAEAPAKKQRLLGRAQAGAGGERTPVSAARGGPGAGRGRSALAGGRGGPAAAGYSTPGGQEQADLQAVAAAAVLAQQQQQQHGPGVGAKQQAQVPVPLARLAPLQRALRDVRSRAEQQMPIVRTALCPPQPSPAAPPPRPIPVPTLVRRVDSPWADAAAAGTATPPVPLPLPQVWSQRRPWDPATASPSPLAGGAAGPEHGCLALSSVDSALQELARSAVRRLRGVRACPAGGEEHATHLVMGQERRTLKVLLAIASGAWLLSPAWLTASIEAERWLPEAAFAAPVRFSAAAARARAGRAAGAAPLLQGQRVHVHASEAARGSCAALKRVAAALGAKAAGRKDASLCILAGEERAVPPGLPPACRVESEEWLLLAAEGYRLPERPPAASPAGP